jgi:hypothetical protein
MRTTIAAIAFAGFLVFGSLFVLSFTNPAFVESVGREVIRVEVERRTHEKVESLGRTKLGAIAERMVGQNTAEAIEIKRRLAEGVPQQVAAVLAQMRDLSCECRKAVERGITEALGSRIEGLARLNERLTLFIRTKYMEVSESLTREFRIFTGANALVFGLLGATVLLRESAALQAALPAAVLVGSAAIVGGLYLFNQNWLHTVLYADYVGLWYFAYLGVAIGLLGDIIFNRARVTTKVVNWTLSVAGSAVQAVPC